MHKKFFRFLRGELNGFYLDSINMTLNKASVSLEDFLSNFRRMVFKNASQVSTGEVPIDRNSLHGLGTFAGVFPPWVFQDSLAGSMRFTTSHKVEGTEYSERGLFSLSSDGFEFQRTNQQQYKTDINTLANSQKRTSMVESGATPLGWFQEGDKVIKDDGSVDTSKLLPSEPVDKASSPWYGLKYLFLAEESPVKAKISDDVFLELVKAMQWVRYNGNSIASLCKFVDTLCSDCLFITDIDWNDTYGRGIVYYGIDAEYEMQDKLLRTEVFKLISKLKFKQYTFTEVGLDVERDENGKVINITVLED